MKHYYMNYKSEIGKRGEDLACEYLKVKKYQILDRNFRKKFGELDIIAKDPANILVFVEVKTIRQCGNGSANSPQDAAIKPEQNLTASKLKKLKRIAMSYAGQNQELVDDEKGWRIDLIALTLLEDEKYNLNHYENIVT